MCQAGCCGEGWYFPKTDFLFVHTSPISNCTLLVIRVFFALYFTGVELYRFYTLKESALFQIVYMTNYGAFLTWIYFVLVVQDRIFGHKYNDNMKNFVTAFYELSLPFQVVITIVYWGFLFDGSSSALNVYLDANVHGIPLAALLLEFIFNSYSFNIRRYLIVLIFAGTYIIINLTYALAYQPVYSILKWTDWFSYVLALASFVIALVIFCFAILIYSYCCKEKKLREMVEGDKEGIHQLDLARFKGIQNKRATVEVEMVDSDKGLK